MNTLDMAHELLAEIRRALASGTRHYNKAGKLLVIEKEIVETLLSEGGIVFETRERYEQDSSNS